MQHPMRERVLIIFIAIIIGLIVTTLIFLLYQQTKTMPQKAPGVSQEKEKGLKTTSYLIIDEPSNESITTKRTLQVKGKTKPNELIIVSTNQEDVVAKPTSDGKFTVSVTIAAGANKIITRSISPNGQEAIDTRVITFTTEEF